MQNGKLKDDKEDRYIDNSLNGLQPRYLQRIAQEHLMENHNATWNDFSAQTIQRDVSFQVSSNFLNDEEQTKDQIATLGQEMKSLRSELQEHRVIAVEGKPRTVETSQKGRQNGTTFCKYCRTNGHTPSCCRKKIRDQEPKRLENEKTAEKKVTFTQDYNKKRGPDHGSEQWTRSQDFQGRDLHYTNDGRTRNSPQLIKIFLPNRTPHTLATIRTMEDHMIDSQINHPIETMEIDLEMDLSTIRTGTGETMEISPFCIGSKERILAK